MATIDTKQTGFTIRCDSHTYITLEFNGQHVFCLDNDSTYAEAEYEELPTVFDPLKAIKPDAPPVHKFHKCFVGNNIVAPVPFPLLGDIEKGFAESDVIVEERYFLPVVKQCQMETASAAADYSPSGSLTV